MLQIKKAPVDLAKSMKNATLPFELQLFGLLPSQPVLEPFVVKSSKTSQYCQCEIRKGRVLVWQCR